MDPRTQQERDIAVALDRLTIPLPPPEQWIPPEEWDAYLAGVFERIERERAPTSPLADELPELK